MDKLSILQRRFEEPPDDPPGDDDECREFSEELALERQIEQLTEEL